MTETPVTLEDIAMLAALANGIIPADERDAGAARFTPARASPNG